MNNAVNQPDLADAKRALYAVTVGYAHPSPSAALSFPDRVHVRPHSKFSVNSKRCSHRKHLLRSLTDKNENYKYVETEKKKNHFLTHGSKKKPQGELENV